MTNAENSGKPSMPVQARLAASVILIRDSVNLGLGLEVFIQHRVSTMDFAADMVVFPGGRVDAIDAIAVEAQPLSAGVVQRHARAWRRTGGEDTLDAGPGCAGSSPSREAAAATLMAAARREVFEETGLLLDAEALLPWANWVTPPDQPKRFDTYFFLAAVGPGQEPRHQTTEASTSHWMAVADILAAASTGDLQLMRPTRFLLEELLAFANTAAAVAAVRDIVPVRGPRGAGLR